MKILTLEEVHEWFKALNQVKYDNPQLIFEEGNCTFTNDLLTISYLGDNKFAFVFSADDDNVTEFIIISYARSEIISLFKSLEVCLAANRFQQKKGLVIIPFSFHATLSCLLINLR